LRPFIHFMSLYVCQFNLEADILHNFTHLLMTGQSKENISATTEQNISFYNEIAGQYNAILNAEDTNSIVRSKVAGKFHDTTKSGLVLDFGGGTGLDLDWLVGFQYEIFFCEPSAGMRQMAIKRNTDLLHSLHINFLEQEKTDFTRWHQQLPFSQQVDAILSNFAVINNIADIQSLFAAMARVLKPGAHLMALMLDNRWQTLSRRHPAAYLKSLFNRRTINLKVQFKGYEQTVYLHTMNKIRKASSTYFDFCYSESISGSGFILIDLIRK
jgi:SAM-dependent methyltransferase